MRRIPLFCLAALALMAWPSAAAASRSWPVYNTSHHRVGSVHKENATTSPSDWDKAVATVWQNTAMVRYCGQITYVWTELGRVKNLWTVWDTNGDPMGDNIKKVSAKRYDVEVYQAEGRYWRTIGKAVRRSSGPWRLMRRVSGGYRKTGSSPRDCPGQDAAAGGYLLLLFGDRPAH